MAKAPVNLISSDDWADDDDTQEVTASLGSTQLRSTVRTATAPVTERAAAKSAPEEPAPAPVAAAPKANAWGAAPAAPVQAVNLRDEATKPAPAAAPAPRPAPSAMENRYDMPSSLSDRAPLGMGPGSSRPGPPVRGPPEDRIPDRPPFTAFVGNLPDDTTEDDLGNFFTDGGCSVEDVRILRHRDTGRVKNAYLDFTDKDSLLLALDANGVEIPGTRFRMRVDVAEQRNNTRDGGRGGPRNTGPTGADFANLRNREQPDRPAGVPMRDAPRERPRLNLLPRSLPPKDQAGAGSDSSAAAASSSDPFGGAKPRDEAAYERRRLELEAERKAKAAAERQSERDRDGRRGGPRGDRDRRGPRQERNRFAKPEEEGNWRDRSAADRPVPRGRGGDRRGDRERRDNSERSDRRPAAAPGPAPAASEESAASKKPVNAFDVLAVDE